MKHIKMNEAEIRKSFIDWLDNPQAPKGESIYTFEFPVKKIYNVDDSRSLDSEALIDFLRYERGNDICQDIANELDLGFYSTIIEEDDIQPPKLSKSEVEANFDEYFDKWIEQEFNNDISKFFRMYDLDYEENLIGKDEFFTIKTSFNEEDLKQFYPFREFNHDFKILRMEITDLKDDNIIVGEIETNRDLKNDEIDSLKDYLEGQCSDGWGETLSQEPEREENYGLNFWVTISTWWNQGFPNWYLKIKEKI